MSRGVAQVAHWHDIFYDDLAPHWNDIFHDELDMDALCTDEVSSCIPLRSCMLSCAVESNEVFACPSGESTLMRSIPRASHGQCRSRWSWSRCRDLKEAPRRRTS